MVHFVFLALSLSSPDVAALKSQARTLAKVTGCTQAAQCKVTPLGSKPCGGPTEFVVYCAASTDEKALQSKAQQATDAEKALNAANQMMGICTALTPPAVKLDNGKCAAVEPKKADLPM